MSELKEVYILDDDSGEAPQAHSRKSLHEALDAELDAVEGEVELSWNVKRNDMTQEQLNALPVQ